MKNFNFKQVRKALNNKGFSIMNSYGDEFWSTYFFEKSSGTEYGLIIATVEECNDSGECTIDALNPIEWGKQNL